MSSPTHSGSPNQGGSPQHGISPQHSSSPQHPGSPKGKGKEGKDGKDIREGSGSIVVDKAPVLTTMSYDNDVQTMLSCVAPRAGGYLKILVPPNEPQEKRTSFSGSPKDDCACVPPTCKTPPPEAHFTSFNPSKHDTTRAYRIQKAMEDPSLDRSPQLPQLDPDDELFEKKPRLNLLAITISTVMMLAAEQDVPLEQLAATLSYLNCIRNENDEMPPNIQGLINYVSLLSGDNQPRERTSLTLTDEEREGRNPNAGSKTEQTASNVAVLGAQPAKMRSRDTSVFKSA